MLLRAYSIYDVKALQYHPPFFASTNGAAVRSVHDLVNDTNTSVGRHPADYVLYCVGEYDDSKGALRPFVPLEHVIDAVSLVRHQPSMFADQPVTVDPADMRRPTVVKS